MNQAVWALAESVSGAMVQTRRWLHQHPEVGFQESETARYVADCLRQMGVHPETGIGGYGIKAVLPGNRPGPTIAIRADMDALPIVEETGLPFASLYEGKMHACGHDVHTAILLGAAQALTQLAGDFAGRVVLIFQSGEEVNPGGASLMAQAGVLDNPPVDAVFALHINPLQPCGLLEFAAGPVMAAPDELEIVVEGRGGHGAYPHLTADPVVAAAQIVVALQQIVSRQVPPLEPAVISVGSIHGGSATNVIADKVVLAGTVRTMSSSLRDLLPGWIERVATGVAAAHGCQAQVNISRGYPPVCNDPAMTTLARRAAARILPAALIGEMEPTMGGEDFAYFLERVPGSICRLGVAPHEGEAYPLHSARLRVDEDAMKTGVAYWLALIQECELHWRSAQIQT